MLKLGSEEEAVTLKRDSAGGVHFNQQAYCRLIVEILKGFLRTTGVAGSARIAMDAERKLSWCLGVVGCGSCPRKR